MSILSDLLGYAGDALDKPGRAVRGVLAGRPDEALAALPFSDSLGWSDPGRRTSGSDLLRSLGLDAGDGLGGDLAGFGAELATDPLTWLGAGLGSRLGLRAGEAAASRGPRYGTGVDDLARVMAEGMEPGHPVAERLMRSPVADRVLSEIPEGSSFLGAGQEGFALRTPAGDALRVGLGTPGAEGRPLAAPVLAPTRAIDVAEGPGLGWRVERTPYAEHVGDPSYWGARDPATMLRPTDVLDKDLAAAGLKLGDRHYGNMGVAGGRPVAIDPGAIDKLPGYAGGFSPVATARDPGALMARLLDLIGADAATRRAIDAGRMGPSFAAPFGVGGAGLGANAGALARS